MICSGGLRNAGRTGSMQAGQTALLSRARDSSPVGIQTKDKRAQNERAGPLRLRVLSLSHDEREPSENPSAGKCSRSVSRTRGGSVSRGDHIGHDHLLRDL